MKASPSCRDRSHRPPFRTSPSADRRSQVRVRTFASRRSFRNKSSKDMAFPHPKSRNGKYGNEHKSSSGGVVRNFFKRTINIAEYRYAEDDVNRAKNPTFCALAHDPSRFTDF